MRFGFRHQLLGFVDERLGIGVGLRRLGFLDRVLGLLDDDGAVEGERRRGKREDQRERDDDWHHVSGHRKLSTSRTVPATAASYTTSSRTLGALRYAQRASAPDGHGQFGSKRIGAAERPGRPGRS